jgi:amino acid transporter
VLFAGVLAAIAGVIVSGFAQGHWQMPASPAMTFPAAVSGLAQATLLTTYCYWGYYNICFLGSEVKRPERTIPRAILLSVLFVAAIYTAMNLAALPAMRDAATHTSAGAAVRLQLVADIARSAFGSWAGRLMAALIIWTAFASVFSLLLGYSRVPYAAARDGNYFRFLAAVHPRHNIPHRSLVALGVVAAAFCFFSLAQVITMLVITRILLQFLLQHIGVMLLRARRPELARPFKMPLYPLPPLLALAGFVFMLANRSHAIAGVGVAAAIAVSGTLIYLVRARRLCQWPFARVE